MRPYLRNHSVRQGILSWIPLVLATALAAGGALAHGGKHAEKAPPLARESEASLLLSRAYEEGVRPLFERSCFDCHGGTTRYPWYYRLPGVRQLIDQDVSEAKEHLDMSAGYPFKGHGGAEEDLRAIAETIRENSMPPFLYRLMHPESRLSDAEKKLVLEWTELIKKP